MTQILTVDPSELINKVAEELKKQKLIEPTKWSLFVKTGHHQERMPDNPEWWYYRAAAILRSAAKLGPIGTQKLRRKFGGKKNRGHKPERFYKASGSVVRKILQQLEKSNLLKQTEKGVHKGRILTAQGKSFLDKIAVQIAKRAYQKKQK